MKTDNSHNRRKSEQGASMFAKSKEIENYFPKERIYRAPLLGDIKLNRTIHRLSTPLLDDPFVEKKNPHLPIKLSSSLLVSEFLDLAKTPFKKKVNYYYCLMRSVKDLTTLQVPIEKLSEIQRVIPNKPFEAPKSREFLKHCKNGDAAAVSECILEDKTLVYSFDELQMTGLH